MPWFEYSGMDRTGDEVRDRLKATDEYDAREKLRQQGLFVTQLRRIEEPQQLATTGASTSLNSPLDEELLALLRAHRKLDAVKAYRDATGVRLFDAKAYVEQLGLRHGIPVSSGCGVRAALLIGISIFGMLMARLLVASATSSS